MTTVLTATATTTNISRTAESKQIKGATIAKRECGTFTPDHPHFPYDYHPLSFGFRQVRV